MRPTPLLTTLIEIAVALAAAGLAWWASGMLGAPPLVAAGLALLAGAAAWRPPLRQRRRARAPARPAPAPRPAVPLGRVVLAPQQRSTPSPGQPFVLGLAELEHHLTVLGATGSGKTTTLGRLIDAALAAGWAVAVLDAKGGRLADVVRSMGARHGVAARIWLPGEPDSWSYDVCAGDPASVTNRLIGAFEHGPDGEVYKNIAQALLPSIVRALQAGSSGCDLETLRRHLDRPRLVGLARHVTHAPLKAELLAMLEEPLHRKALAGLAGRLGALGSGAFGPWLLPSARTLDLAASLSQPGVTYLGLPATGASEEVALVGRVLIQELKQLGYRFLRSEPPCRALIVVDEFASLREAGQLVDLLLQAREARLALVVSSQYIPRAPALRHAVLGAGVLLLHQIGSAEDADLLARTLGARPGLDVAYQVHQAAARRPSTRRLVRPGHDLLVPPDELRRLPVGRAVVCVRHGEQRTAVVQIDPSAP